MLYNRINYLVLLLALGCAGEAEEDTPIRVWISPTVAYQDEVKAAIAGWQEVTQHVRKWDLVEATADEVSPADPEAHPSPADLAIYQIGSAAGTCAGDATTTLGCSWGIGGLWHNYSGSALSLFLISPSDADENPKLVTMHEIGHLLGLTHQDGGLMQAEATQEMLAADWECPDPESVHRLSVLLKVDNLVSCALPKF